MSKGCFHLYTCNTLENLGECFSKFHTEKLEQFRGKDIFEQEQICVATQGMGTWLMQYLVKHGHIIANVQFPFIRNVIDEILQVFMAGDSSYHPELFKEQVLIWRIYRLLGKGQLPKNLCDYLEKKSQQQTDDVRRYQLAVKLAQLYYDYMAFIPEKLEGLQEVDEKQRWQIDLWKQLCKDDNGEPITSPAAAMLKFISKETVLDGTQYKPVTFFGISAMSPYFLLMLKKLSTVQTVNFFYLNYCDEFWADAKSDWEKREDSQQLVDKHYSNRLLGNLGMLGREFFKAIIDEEDDAASPMEEHTWDSLKNSDSNKCSSLLEAIQQGIKNYTEDADNSQMLPAEQDDSLTVHSCFNAIRQVEALQESLLRLIKEYKNEGQYISLNDIIIMAPDISSFAPAIQTVFDRGPLKGKYCISDRSVKNANHLAEVFLQIMALSKGHFEVSRISTLLDSAPLRKKFGFDDENVPTLRSWLNKAGIRWGFDKNDRAECGNFEEYSWQYGMDRLLAKMAFDGHDNDENDIVGFGGLNPVDFGSGKDGQALLNSLCRFYKCLHDFLKYVETANANGGVTAQNWCDFLMEQRALFFQIDSDSALEYSQLGRVLSNLKAALGAAGFAEEAAAETDDMRVPFSVILSAMESSLQFPAETEPFLNGKITFCSLLPMRGIPCKIIALLGMDTGSFPRRDDGTGYNLVRLSKGTNLLKYYDRSRSVEDRFTFLEALMSARDYLMIFYNGQNEQNLEKLQPAAPVSELLSFISRDFNREITVKHTLNGFSPESFQEIPTYPSSAESKQYSGALLKLFSFDSDRAKLAQMLCTPKDSTASKRILWREAYELPLPERLPNGWKSGNEITISLNDLLAYLKSPSDIYASSRLGLPKKEWDEAPLSDYEPAALDKKAAGSIDKNLSLTLLSKQPEKVNGQLKNSRAKCELPVGTLGDMAIQKECWNSKFALDDFAGKYLKQEQSEPQEIELDLGEIAPMQEWCKLGLEMYGIDSCTGLKELNFKVKLKGNLRFYEDENQVGVYTCLYGSKSCSPKIQFYLQHLLLGASRQNDNGEKCLSYCIEEPTDKKCTLLGKPIFERPELGEILENLNVALATFNENAAAPLCNNDFCTLMDKINSVMETLKNEQLEKYPAIINLLDAIRSVDTGTDKADTRQKGVLPLYNALKECLENQETIPYPEIAEYRAGSNGIDKWPKKLEDKEGLLAILNELKQMEEDSLVQVQNLCQQNKEKAQASIDNAIAQNDTIAKAISLGIYLKNQLELLCSQDKTIDFTAQLRQIVSLYIIGKLYPLPLLGKSINIVMEEKKRTLNDYCKMLFGGNDSLLFKEWIQNPTGKESASSANLSIVSNTLNKLARLVYVKTTKTTNEDDRNN